MVSKCNRLLLYNSWLMGEKERVELVCKSNIHDRCVTITMVTKICHPIAGVKHSKRSIYVALEAVGNMI